MAIELHHEDELLEALWTLREDGKPTISDLQERLGPAADAGELGALESGGWVSREKDQFKFTALGEERAAQIIRRHRLAERLIQEVMDVAVDATEDEACHFEHLLGSQVTDSICTLLGHPPTCPHGKPIPRGACCARLTRDLKPLVARLTDCVPGEVGVISFLTPRFRGRFERLSSLGLVPGSVIRLQQKSPAYVVYAGETQIALDEEIAREIYVKRLSRDSAFPELEDPKKPKPRH